MEIENPLLNKPKNLNELAAAALDTSVVTGVSEG